MSDIEIDKLLEIANQEGDSNSESSSNNITNKSVYDFIKAFNIASGETKVPNYMIFFKYITYKRERNEAGKCGKTEFFRHFKKEFNQVRSNSCRYYLLNECFELSEEGLRKAEAYDKKNQR